VGLSTAEATTTAEGDTLGFSIGLAIAIAITAGAGVTINRRARVTTTGIETDADRLAILAAIPETDADRAAFFGDF
jgi:hypothetical protein